MRENTNFSILKLPSENKMKCYRNSPSNIYKHQEPHVTNSTSISTQTSAKHMPAATQAEGKLPKLQKMFFCELNNSTSNQLNVFTDIM